MTSLKISNLVRSQVPEFVRDEYPKFISFLEAYYEFLEKKQGTQQNDLINQSKSLRYLSDVDISLDTFENNFYEKFASLLPRDTAVRKDILFKNLTNLYLSKGSSSSYKLLFRMLFGEELEIIEPKNEVLRASASTWSVENSLRVDPDTLYLIHEANGTSKTFLLPSNSFTVKSVLINDVETTAYLVNQNSKKIIFNTAPTTGSVIKIFFNDFDYSLLLNRKVTGKTSRASGIVERFAVSLVSNRNIEDLYINSKTVIGIFANGEYCVADIIVDENLLNIEFLTSSALRSISVIEGGSNYSNGDFIIVSGGGAEREAVAVIEEVFSGYIDTIRVNKPGAGFAVGGIIDAIDPPLVVNGSIGIVNTSSSNVTNTYTILSDILIANLASITVGATDYAIAGKSVSNTSKIITLMNPRSITVGAISNCIVVTANSVSTSVPIVETQGAVYTTGTVIHSITGFRSIGGYTINGAGQDYRVGDEVIFGPNPVLTAGVGAAARVSATDAGGRILKIDIEPSRLTGTANVTANSHIVTGTGTSFNTEITVGDRIIVNGESRYVNAVTSATSINCNVEFIYTTTDVDAAIGKYWIYPTGGINYTQNNFPTVTVRSRIGTSANVSIDSCMGDGENLTATGSKLPGAIVKIKIIDGGRGYKYIPFINLTQSGDGLANAQAEIESSFVTFEGKWTTSDSIISSTERKIQGKDYYVDYSYITSSRIEFRKYKQILKDLLHPAGLINYARYRIDKEANVTNLGVTTISPNKVISGKVNIGQGSIYITGVNTKFVDGYNKGYIGIGDGIDVNGRIYIVESIISNTNVQVSQVSTSPPLGVISAPVPFNVTANLEPFIVLGQVTGVSPGSAEMTLETGDLLVTEDGIILTTE
jgi:hypothetical protein